MPEDKRALYSFFVRAGDGPSGHTHFADDGDKKLKKPDRKAKPVRGDQQKLRKGSGCPPIDQHPRDRRTDDCSHAPYLIFLRTQIS